MAFKLMKAESAERDRLAGEMDAKGQALAEAVDAFNEAVAAAHAELRPKVDALNAVRQEAQSWAERIAEDRRGDFEDRPERWQEGEKGQEANEWLEAWEGFRLDDVEVEEPDPLELDGGTDGGGDDLRELPEAAG